MVNVVCVLKSGGDFEPWHVYRLRDHLNRHITIPWKFHCFTDYPDLNCRTRKLELNLAGWWSQIECFKPGLFSGQTFYLDLDVAIVSNIDDMISQEVKFAIAKEYRSNDNRPTSTLMSFNQNGARFVWRDWERNKDKIDLNYRNPLSLVFFQKYTKYQFLQDLFPNRICSFKKNWVKGTAPKTTSIVCFHGRPKPWDINPEKFPKLK